MPYIPTGNEVIDPFRFLQEAGIRAGMKVADFGCGTLGHYVFPAARLVGPEGTVYAVDILKSVLQGIGSRSKMETANNVVPLWGDIERPGGVQVPDGSLDMVILANNISMSSARPAMLAECRRALRSGGRLAVAEWKTTGVTFSPDRKRLLSPEEVKSLAANAGLTLAGEFEPGRFHYGLTFLKP